MNTGLISTRYATALLDFAVEQNLQERVYSTDSYRLRGKYL